MLLSMVVVVTKDNNWIKTRSNKMQLKLISNLVTVIALRPFSLLLGQCQCQVCGGDCKTLVSYTSGQGILYSSTPQNTIVN